MAHFPPQQVGGDLVRDGACALEIGHKLGVSQPTCARHLKILTDAGLIIPTRRHQWTFYKRDEKQLRALKARIRSDV